MWFWSDQVCLCQVNFGIAAFFTVYRDGQDGRRSRFVCTKRTTRHVPNSISRHIPTSITYSFVEIYPICNYLYHIYWFLFIYWRIMLRARQNTWSNFRMCSHWLSWFTETSRSNVRASTVIESVQRRMSFLLYLKLILFSSWIEFIFSEVQVVRFCGEIFRRLPITG